MKKHWLRGLLLGVSLALLLSGGVALAANLFFTVFDDCVWCWPGPGWPTEDKYLLHYSMGGWDTNYDLCVRATIDGVLLEEGCSDDFPSEDPYEGAEPIPCEWQDNELASVLVHGNEASIANGPPGPLGVWKYELWQVIPGMPDPYAQASWLVAEVCEAEFVPEPASIMLLGSGLAGLAGYAALRWRTKE